MEENIEVRERNKKRRLYILGPFILLIALVGVGYAIFNYTRIGTANVIKVGKISFNSNQTETINLTNVFPIDSANVNTDTTNVDETLITITGDTTYPNGIEYLLTAVDVNNTVGSGNNQKTVPISIAVTATNGLGTEDDSYYANRGSTTSVYKVLAGDEIIDDGELVVGYIAAGQTGVSGSVTIKAYLDKDKIGISDTYDGTESDNMGTTNEWADGRTILTTTEWNSLQQNGVSFKVKVEANEGVWVEEPLPTAAETIGALLTETNAAGNKIYTGSDPDNYVWFNNEQWRIIGVYGNNLKIIKATPSTTSQVYNSDTSSNAWSGSTMQTTYLYNTYWPTLSQAAQNMIEQNATWNVGACGYQIAAQAAYTCASSTTWTGKIGLIASYESLYAAENDGTCWTTSGYDYDGGCYQKDWLFSTVTNSGSFHAWTLSPFSDDSNYALFVDHDGYVYSNYVDFDYAASPVVYLKSTITITGGNGQEGETNSYKLG